MHKSSAFILHSSSFITYKKMRLPTLPSSSNSQVFMEGDVSIDASAAIAPGVILRADPDSQITIAAGVCIGMGAVLHACGGTLEVEAGANLGAGVLIVGKSTIGANACIGAVTTIWNKSIEPWQVVSAASVIGDTGRQVVGVSSPSTSTSSPETSNSPGSSTTIQTSKDPHAIAHEKEPLNGQVPANRAESATDEDRQESLSPEASSSEPKTEKPTSESTKPVYGQGSLDRILKTLLPYNQQSLNRQSFNRPPEDD
jgi:carbon dioxide concentrating mechanism protein CcmN